MAQQRPLIAVCLLAALLGADHLQLGRAQAGALARPKRDTDKHEPGAALAASAQAASIVSASVQHGREPDADESSSVASGAGAGADTTNQVDSSSAASPKRAQAGGRPAPLAADDDDDVRPAASRPKKRRPAMNRRPPPARYYEGDEYEDENCYDDYPDYGMMVHANAARNHFRHMNRMMGGMFNQMRSLAAGDYDSLPVGPSAAAASAFGGGGAGGDSYSRGFSIVTNNGRTRGLVTETRNGRTRTRRIGDVDDDE